MQNIAKLLLFFLLCCGGLRGDNWPKWRGPLESGVSAETGLPAEWSEGSNVAWRTRLRGLGVSSPVAWGDHVFVTYQIGASKLREGRHPSLVQGGDAVAAGEVPLGGERPGGTDDKVALVVAAFQLSNGELVWEHELAAEGPFPEVHEKRNLATPSPVTDGERVYAWFSSGQIVAVDMEGNRVWSRHLGQEFSAFDIGWGHASSPALHEDRLILNCYQPSSSYLLALDKRTGEQIWKADRGTRVISYATPLIVDGPNGAELIVNSSEGIEAFYPATGEPIWHYNEESRFPIPVASYEDGVLYTSRGYRSGPYMAIETGGQGDIAESHVRWRADTGAPYVSSLVQYQGLVYMANGMGIFTCVDAKTGERVWQERLGGIYTASPVAGDGKVYFPSETGETLVLRAGRTAEVLARNKLNEQFIASPAIAGGQLVLRSTRHLIAVGQ